MNAVGSPKTYVPLALRLMSEYTRSSFPLLQTALIVMLSVVLAFAALPTLAVLSGIAGAAVLLYLYPWSIWVGIGLLLPLTSRFRIGPASATDLLLLLAIWIWFVQSIRDQRLSLYRHPAVPVLSIYISIMAVSAYLAQDLGEALTEMLKWIQFVLVVVLLPAGITGKHTHLVIAGLLLGAVSQALLGVYQFVFRIGPDWFAILGSYMRASGSFRQPNPYAGYLGLTIPLGFSLMLWSFHRWLERGCSSRRLAPLLAYGAAFVILLVGLVASWSRGGWLGASAALVVTYLATRTNLRAVLLYGVLVICVGIAVSLAPPGAIPTPLLERFESIAAFIGAGETLTQPTTDANFSVQERLAHWVAAQRMWSQSPWWGVGPGNYAYVYPSVRLLAWEEPLGHAHNYYLNVLAETGVVGFTSFALVWIALGIRAASVLVKTSSTSLQRAVGAGLLGLLAHLAVHSVVDNLFVQGIYLHIALWFTVLEISGNAHPPYSR